MAGDTEQKDSVAQGDAAGYDASVMQTLDLKAVRRPSGEPRGRVLEPTSLIAASVTASSRRAAR